MIKVTATANGYYGFKHRVPGEEFGIAKAEDFSENWMVSDDPKLGKKSKGDAPEQTRRVNTGGTDGVVGVELPASGAKLSAKERIALAQQISGRTDDIAAKDADAIIAAAQVAGGSANDDRTRDMASDPGNNAPNPLDHDANGKKGGAKKAADDGDI